jgi:16S rRNA (guanine966-N2)-methyltransferase
MNIRITTGVLKGRVITAPLRALLRPTTDMARQRLFNILGDTVPGCVFLDLYAGTGAVGFEALSRGAEKAVFVEQDPQAALAIREAAGKFGLSGKCEVICADASQPAGNELAGRCFDIIFLDPPYDLFPAPGLGDLAALLKAGGRMIYEHSSRKMPQAPDGLLAQDLRKAGDGAFSFFIRKTSAAKG